MLAINRACEILRTLSEVKESGGVRASKNSLFHKNNVNTDKNCQNQLFQKSEN